MITDVTRAYIPTVKFGSIANQNVSAANLLGGSPYVLKVDPMLIHRKVWAWIWSTAAFSLDFDLVALLNNGEVYRQKLAVYNSAGGANRWFSAINLVSTNIGAVNEQVFSLVNGTTLYSISPWRLNITCDTFQLAVNSATGASLDYGLYVQSQKGI
jgi:hypothetical protein